MVVQIPRRKHAFRLGNAVGPSLTGCRRLLFDARSARMLPPQVQSAQANLALARRQLAQAEGKEVDFTKVVATMWLNAQAERTRILVYLNEVRLTVTRIDHDLALPQQ